MVAGNVGARERFEYTVIGEPVNEAARLCELAKDVPQRLVASAETVARATETERTHWRQGDTVTLRGHDEPTRLAVPADDTATTPTSATEAVEPTRDMPMDDDDNT